MAWDILVEVPTGDGARIALHSSVKRNCEALRTLIRDSLGGQTMDAYGLSAVFDHTNAFITHEYGDRPVASGKYGAGVFANAYLRMESISMFGICQRNNIPARYHED